MFLGMEQVGDTMSEEPAIVVGERLLIKDEGSWSLSK
jgi:hypothetical protein